MGDLQIATAEEVNSASEVILEAILGVIPAGTTISGHRLITQQIHRYSNAEVGCGDFLDYAFTLACGA